jgi:hypothetical protein
MAAGGAAMHHRPQCAQRPGDRAKKCSNKILAISRRSVYSQYRQEGFFRSGSFSTHKDGVCADIDVRRNSLQFSFFASLFQRQRTSPHGKN